MLLLISGGHSQYLIVNDVNNYKQIGTTIDDALGEAFDKTAKMLGLGFPGGPNVEKFAKKGNANSFKLPQPIINRAGCNFSFAGLKTAVMRETKKLKIIINLNIILLHLFKKQLIVFSKETEVAIQTQIFFTKKRKSICSRWRCSS